MLKHFKGNPYNETHYTLLKDLQRELSELHFVLDKEEACGMECHQKRTIASAMEETLAAMEKHFFAPD